MGDVRPAVLLDGDDARAALQILAFLAYPARSEYGLCILTDWARHDLKRQGLLGDWRTHDKPSRIEARLRKLDAMVRLRLNTGNWLRRKIGELTPTAWGTLGGSLRSSARLAGLDESNMLRDWRRSQPVAHLAMSAWLTIPRFLYDAGSRRWDLRLIAFRPDWVPAVVRDA